MSESEKVTDEREVEFITICSSKHLDVWKLTSTMLDFCFPNSRFTVVVPFEERQLFQDNTPKVFQILIQEEVGSVFIGKLRQAMDEANNSKRFGWYFQQFLKYQALAMCKANRAVIWDADCVPTRRFQLFSAEGQPIYMLASSELHLEYFSTIQKLLGLKRVQKQSFVIPGFPLPTQWALEFLAAIEAKNPNQAWYEAIIDKTDLSLSSAFSETETLGTWIANNYPDNFSTTTLSWERFGQSRFDYAKNLSPEKIKHIGKKWNLDIISFENWDKRNFSSRIRNILRSLRLIGSLGKFKSKLYGQRLSKSA